MLNVNTQYIYPSLQSCYEDMNRSSSLLDVGLSYKIYRGGVVLPVKIGKNANNEKAALGGCLRSWPTEVNRGMTIADWFIDGTGVNYFTGEGYCPEEVFDMDEGIVYLGYLHDCYGHNITDCLKNVWFFKSDEWLSIKDKLKIAYVSMAPIKQWQRELFSYVGINLDECICITRPTRFRSILVPDGSFRCCEGLKRKYTREYSQTIDLLISNALKNSHEGRTWPEKIYFTRTRWRRQRDDYGENLIENELKALGFTILSPERYTIAEQIAFCTHCRVFCATDGSVAHNALFVHRETEVYILRKGLKENEYTALIAALRGFKLTLIDCSLSLINRKGKFAYAGPFFIYPNKQFCDCFVCKRKIFPFKEFRKYMSNLYRYDDMSERLQVEDEYRTIMQSEIEYAIQRVESCLNKTIPFKESRLGKRIFRFLRRRIIELLLS